MDLLAGPALNLPVTAELEQRGRPDLSFEASFRSEAFTPPILWAIRVGTRIGDADWGVELMHHKLYLEDPPDAIGAFSVSHGLNLLTLDHRWPLGRGALRVGGGIILAHPEGTIRGTPIDESGGIRSSGYHLTGPVVRGGVVFAPRLHPHASFVVEGRATAGRVRLAVPDGHVAFPVITFHLLAGLRFHGP